MTVAYSFCNILRSFSIASLTCDLRSLPFLALNFSSIYISLMHWSLCSSCSDVTKLTNIFSHFSFLSLNWNLDHPWKRISLQVSKACSIWNYAHMLSLAGEIRHCSCWNILSCFLVCLAFRYTSLMLRGLSPYSLPSHMHSFLKTLVLMPSCLSSTNLPSASWTPLIFYLGFFDPWSWNQGPHCYPTWASYSHDSILKLVLCDNW